MRRGIQQGAGQGSLRSYQTTDTRPLPITRRSGETSGTPCATAVPAMSRSNGSRSAGRARASDTIRRSSGRMRSPALASSDPHQSSNGRRKWRRPRSSSCAISNRHTAGMPRMSPTRTVCFTSRRAAAPKLISELVAMATSGAVSSTARSSGTTIRSRRSRAGCAAFEGGATLVSQRSKLARQFRERSLELGASAQRGQGIAGAAALLWHDASHDLSTPREIHGVAGASDLLDDASETLACGDKADAARHVYRSNVPFGARRSTQCTRRRTPTRSLKALENSAAT